eukprot:TRINITY_DN10934_c0_g2_i1.p1 TRINITY_DN10934_c0_g2~~TRINITY_DN10934_c0_g2_i1.p1  ORF type:complete len:383 (+),score=56.76 TRINITY_DN10934_c0_g2_i1:246-1394(+)
MCHLAVLSYSAESLGRTSAPTGAARIPVVEKCLCELSTALAHIRRGTKKIDNFDSFTAHMATQFHCVVDCQTGDIVSLYLQPDTFVTEAALCEVLKPCIEYLLQYDHTFFMSYTFGAFQLATAVPQGAQETGTMGLASLGHAFKIAGSPEVFLMSNGHVGSALTISAAPTPLVRGAYRCNADADFGLYIVPPLLNSLPLQTFGHHADVKLTDVSLAECLTSNTCVELRYFDPTSGALVTVDGRLHPHLQRTVAHVPRPVSCPATFNAYCVLGNGDLPLGACGGTVYVRDATSAHDRVCLGPIRAAAFIPRMADRLRFQATHLWYFTAIPDIEASAHVWFGGCHCRNHGWPMNHRHVVFCRQKVCILHPVSHRWNVQPNFQPS